MKRIAFILLLLASYAHNALAQSSGEYKAFVYNRPTGCIGQTTEEGGVPECYDSTQNWARYIWGSTLRHYSPAPLPSLTVAQLPTCSSTVTETHFSEAVITDSLNICTAGNTIAGGGIGNSCHVACLQNSSTWAWSIIGSLGGGGSGGGVAAVGANAPIFLTGSASNPIVNLTVPLASQYGANGVSSPTPHTFGIAEGSSPFTFISCPANQFLAGVASADPACRLLANSDLPTSGVSAGSYTVANITVNAQGIITSISNGSVFTNPMTTLGDIIYENATPAPARLAGNTSATQQFLTQTGTGSVSAAPSWATIGGTCTNQVVTAISSAGVPTCANLPPPSLTGTTSAAAFDFQGTPAASAILAITCPFTFNFPANFATPNSVATCGSNPAETDTYTVAVAGSTIGTVALSTSCVATFATSGGATKTCTAGQRLEIDAPGTVSGADIAITLAFTR